MRDGSFLHKLEENPNFCVIVSVFLDKPGGRLET